MCCVRLLVLYRIMHVAFAALFFFAILTLWARVLAGKRLSGRNICARRCCGLARPPCASGLCLAHRAVVLRRGVGSVSMVHGLHGIRH